MQDGNLLHAIKLALLVGGVTCAQAAQHARVVGEQLAGTLELRRATGQHHTLLPLTTTRHPDACAVRGWSATVQTTPQLAALLPIYLTAHVQRRGVLLGVDRERRVPHYAVIDDLDARNAVICGWTGSGKSSYAATLLQRHIRDAGYQGIVLDPQGAFAPLAAGTPGAAHYSVTFQRDGGMQVNPLDLIIDDLHEPGQRMQQILHVVQVLTWLHGQPLTTAQQATLELALDTLYQQWPLADPCAHPPLLRDLLAVVEAQHDPDAMAAILRRFVAGPYSVLLDRPTTLDLQLTPDCPLIVYDVSDARLPNQLKGVLLLLITSAIQRAVRSRPRKALIVLDEAGVLFNDPTVAAFAETIAKTIRRYGGALWLIDQTLNLLATKAGDEVFQNSAILAIGTLQIDQRAMLRERFPMLTAAQIDWCTGVGLTDAERASRRGTFLVLLGGAVYPLYNSLSSAEWALIARPALIETRS